MKQYLRVGGVAVLFMTMVFSVMPAGAIERTEAEQKSAELKQKAEEVRQRVSGIRIESKQRLDDTKRRVCASHQASINKLISHVIGQRQKQIDHVGEIATRVQNFYVKQGHELANYDALVSDVNMKKAVAQAALDAAKPNTAFSCDGDGPKAELQAFRDKRSVVVATIKEYRQSVKNLIVGVKSVQSDQEAKR